MNLFEAEINKLNINPDMKRSIIALRKICLESEYGDMPQITPGAHTDNSREALAAIKDTINMAMAKVGNSKNGNLDSDELKKAVIAKIKEYRRSIEAKFGPQWGNALELEANKRIQKLL